MEGEDAEDDIMYLTKKPFFGKIKSYSREVSGLMSRSKYWATLKATSHNYYLLLICFQRTSDGFDSVPLKSSSSHRLREDEDSDDS